MTDGTQVCPTCKATLPLEDFPPDKARPRGRQSVCRPCKAAAMRASYPSRRAKVQATNKRWAEANPDRRRAIANKWDRAHPERSRREYDRNPTRVLARKEKWRQANRDATNETARRRRVRKYGSMVMAITPELIEAKIRFWGGICWMCGGDSDQMDHVKPIARGGAHVLANMRPACGPCNRRKGARWPFPTSRSSFPGWEAIRTERSPGGGSRVA